MQASWQKREWCGWVAVLCGVVVVGLCGGCQAGPTSAGQDLAVRGAIEHYRAERADRLQPGTCGSATQGDELCKDYAFARYCAPAHACESASENRADAFLTLASFDEPSEPTSQPTTQPARRAASATAFAAPEGYWRKDLWHQMGHEAKQLGGHDFWKGFKTSFWDVENALLLTATMGASITIRETGVDGTIRARTKGHRQLGEFDETIQILGNPATHFAGTGVLWLASALLKDVKEHEVAKSLTQALAVNGVATLALKAAANTRTPDQERFGWPSGHTSSAFTAAAVLNEYYGPWVGVPSLALAGLVGYQRLDSRVHDFSDVVFGGMLGYVIGTSIAREEKARFPELFGMQVIPFLDPETGASGLALYKEW